MDNHTLMEFIRFLNVYARNQYKIDIDDSDYENYINYFSSTFTCKEYILFSEFLKVINNIFYEGEYNA